MRLVATLAALAASASLTAVYASHDESIGARFVQPGGIDAGDCLDHDTPCVSIPYALAQAEPGNTVKVGAGVYDLRGLDPESYLYGPIRATGGYDDADHYFESRPEKVRSIVIGVDARYRNALAVRGFYWAESAAAAARGEASLAGGTSLQATQAASATCVQGAAGQFPCRNIDFLAQIPLSQFSSRPLSAANVWGFHDQNDGREYAVLGLRNGTAIVDVTDPVNPREVVTIPGNSSAWREVKVYQVRDNVANRWRAYAYVTTEAANSGIQTIDLSGLPNTAALASTIMDTSSQHALYVSNIDYETNAPASTLPATLYVAGSNMNGGSWRAYSLANPATPQLIGNAPTTRYMHDSTGIELTGPRTAQCAPGHNPCELLVDFNVDQVELWDVTSKIQPVLVGTGTNPNNRYIHSGWPTSSIGNYVVFHDELEEIQFGQRTRLYTLDLTSNLASPGVVVSYEGPTTTTDHNGYARGSYYYVSHYRRGVVIFDLTNPTQLVEVGHFDNYLAPSANSAGTDGTWGVYPYLRSGTLLVSDIENGLFLLRDGTRRFDLDPGRLGFAETALTGVETGGVSVRVQRVAGYSGAVTVDYATAAGTATEGTDYTATRGTLTWSHRDLADKIVTIPVTDDAAVEGSETFTITLTNLTGSGGTPTLDGSSTLTVTIADNDTPPPAAGGGGGGGGTEPAWLLLLVAALVGRMRRRHRTG